MLTILGATYDEYLTPKASVLICNTSEPNSEKLRHVHEWKIPAVIGDWLWISVQTGEKKPFGPYLISKGQKFRIEEPNVEGQHANNAPRPIEKESMGAVEEQVGQAAPSHDNKELPNSNALQEVSTNSPQKTTYSPSSPTRDSSIVLPAYPIRTDAAKAKEPNSKKPLDVALNEFLRQRRETSRASMSEEKEVRPRRRRQLLGRANSHSSTLTIATGAGASNPQNGFSRASSIDTMNEDGCGSVVDGIDSPKKGKSNVLGLDTLLPNNENKSEAQRLLEGRLDIFRAEKKASADINGNGLNDDDVPPMTQLGYEDPDAVAMREKFTSKTNESKATDPSSEAGLTLTLGTLKSHAMLDGWGSGRRTRRAGKSLQGQ